MRDKLLKIKRSRYKPEELYLIDLFNEMETFVDEDDEINYIKGDKIIFKTSNIRMMRGNMISLGVDYDFVQFFLQKFNLKFLSTTLFNVLKQLNLNYTNIYYIR